MPAAIAIPLIVAGASAGTTAAVGIYGAKKQAGAARTAATLQTGAANHAADLEAQSARDALAYTKSAEATRKVEFDKTQALNVDQYNQQLARLAPYRTLGGIGVAGLTQGLTQGDGRTLLPPPTRRRTLG